MLAPTGNTHPEGHGRCSSARLNYQQGITPQNPVKQIYTPHKQNSHNNIHPPPTGTGSWAMWQQQQHRDTGEAQSGEGGSALAHARYFPV